MDSCNPFPREEKGGLIVESSVLPIDAVTESYIVTMYNMQAYLGPPDLPEDVLATGEYDTGLVSCAPYRVILKPDIHAVLANISHDATHFTGIDSKNVFFSVPVDKETRPFIFYYFFIFIFPLMANAS